MLFELLLLLAGVLWRGALKKMSPTGDFNILHEAFEKMVRTEKKHWESSYHDAKALSEIYTKKKYSTW